MNKRRKELPRSVEKTWYWVTFKKSNKPNAPQSCILTQRKNVLKQAYAQFFSILSIFDGIKDSSGVM